MYNDLSFKAIEFALDGNWKEAKKVNEKILKLSPNDVDAMNRLAKSYTELGNSAKAATILRKVLRIDPFNSIAIKCLEKNKQLTKTPPHLTPTKVSTHTLCSPDFIDEPGKTKTIQLISTAPQSFLNTICCGDDVILNPVGYRISVLDLSGKYIGRFPDQIGVRIKSLIKGGNTYKISIKSIDGSVVKVFIKEEKKSPQMELTTSFPIE